MLLLLLQFVNEVHMLHKQKDILPAEHIVMSCISVSDIPLQLHATQLHQVLKCRIKSIVLTKQILF